MSGTARGRSVWVRVEPPINAQYVMSNASATAHNKRCGRRHSGTKRVSNHSNTHAQEYGQMYNRARATSNKGVPWF